MAAGLVAIGVTLTVAAYASALLSMRHCDGCDRSSDKDAFLVLIPVAGPLLTAANQSGLSAGQWTFFSIWSAVEAIGTTLLTIGFVGEDVPARYSPEGRVVFGLAPTIVLQPTTVATGLVLNARF